MPAFSQFFNHRKINHRFLIVSAICLLALFFRYERLNNREWWHDEKVQYKYMGGPGPIRPFWQKIQYIGGDHTAFPGEYVLAYPFIQLFEDNK